MKRKLLAIVLAAVMIVGMFTGCNDTKNNEDHPASSQKDSEAISTMGKYAFRPEWISIDFDGEYEISYIADYVIHGNTMFFYGDCITGKEPWVDEFTGEPVIDEYTGEPIMNTIFETCVFKMDIETGKAQILSEYQPHAIPEGFEGNSYINRIQSGQDGTIWISEQVNTYYYDLPADFDEETDSPYNYYMPGDSMICLHQLSADGALLQMVELKLEPETYLGNTVIVGDKIYATDWMNIRCYDFNGQQIGTIEVENSINNLFDLGNGEVAAWIWMEDGSYLFPVNMDDQTLGEGMKLEANAYTLYPGGDDYDYIYDYNGTFYGHSDGMEESEKLFSWIDCDVDSSYLYGTTRFGENGYVYSLENTYDEKSQEQKYSLLSMEPVDPSTLPVKQELTLACLYLEWDLRSDIVEFNRSHDDVRIVVKEYAQYATEDNSLAGLQKLNTEIMSGMVPDLFLINGEMPVSQYAAKGVFMDLWPLIDSDPELNREDLMTHFFDALSVDGKLYQIVDSFGISTLVGKESVVGTGSSWTMDDLMAALDQQPEGTTIFGQYDTKESILNNFISRNANSFIDWKTLQCSFDSQEFIDYLEFANQFPDEINYETMYKEEIAVEEYQSEAAMLRSGTQMLYRAGLYSFSSLQWANAVFGEKANFIGYPTTANNGSCFEISGGLAISSTCANTDAAWSFIRFYLTEEHQTQDYMYQFPTNKHAFDTLVASSMKSEYDTDPVTGEKKPVPVSSIWYGMEEEVLLYAMTQEEADLFMEIYENCHNFYSYDQEITKLISEEAASFFDGQKTAEEAAKLIQDRVSLYVMEQG